MCFLIAMLLQIFWRNFYSNTVCFSLLLLYLGNSQVNVYRTIGPTLVFYPVNPFLVRRYPVMSVPSDGKFWTCSTKRIKKSVWCTCTIAIRYRTVCSELVRYTCCTYPVYVRLSPVELQSGIILAELILQPLFCHQTCIFRWNLNKIGQTLLKLQKKT